MLTEQERRLTRLEMEIEPRRRDIPVFTYYDRFDSPAEAEAAARIYVESQVGELTGDDVLIYLCTWDPDTASGGTLFTGEP